MEQLLIVVLWTLIFLTQVHGRTSPRRDSNNLPGSKPFLSHPTCPKRADQLEPGRTCQKKCLVDEDCKGRRRQCRCDGVCGLTCIRTGMKCTRLEDIENGFFELDPDNSFGSLVRYSCSDGFILSGKRERTCQGDRKWSGQSPKCVTEGVCKSPPKVVNALFNVTSSPFTFKNMDMKLDRKISHDNDVIGDVTYPLGTQFMYTCVPGYELTGYQRAMCVGEGRWVGPYITCSPVPCPFPGNVPNAHRITGSKYHYQDRVNYTCLPGYTLEGNQQRTCQQDMTWSGELPKCRQIVCPKPAPIDDGHVDGDDFSFGSVIKYRCLKGHLLVGDASRKCLKDATWSGIQPSCQVIHCEPLESTDNVYFSTTDTVFNTTVHFRCVGNSKSFDDSLITTCNEHGQWTNPVTRCYSKCRIPKPHKGELSRQDVEGTFVDHGYKLNFTCQPGNVLELLPECNNGAWQPQVECQPSKKSCSSVRPPELKDGFFRIFKTKHGDEARYYCDAGYTLEGEDSVTCLDGAWVGPATNAVCKQKTCDYPGGLQNGFILLVGVKGKFQYRPYVRKIGQNEMIEFRCNKEYELIGSEGATCVDGKWSPENKPVCKLRHHLPATKIKFYRGK